MELTLINLLSRLLHATSATYNVQRAAVCLMLINIRCNLPRDWASFLLGRGIQLIVPHCVATIVWNAAQLQLLPSQTEMQNWTCPRGAIEEENENENVFAWIRVIKMRMELATFCGCCTLQIEFNPKRVFTHTFSTLP